MRTFIQIGFLPFLFIACDTYKTVTQVTIERTNEKSVTRIQGTSQILYSGCCGCIGKVYTRRINKVKELEFFSDCNCSGKSLTAEVTVRKVFTDGTIKRFIFTLNDTLVKNKSKYHIRDFFEQKELDLITSDTTEHQCAKLKYLILDKFLIQRILTIKRLDGKNSSVNDSTFFYSNFIATTTYKRETKLTDNWSWSK